MMRPAVRNRLIIGVVVLMVGGFIAYHMFFSLTPPRHADHDHAIATLDAGGFLWVVPETGRRRNLVGRPDKVLILQWFDTGSPDSSQPIAASAFADRRAADPAVEVLLIGRAATWDELRTWASTAGLSTERLYLDPDGTTGELFGVRRFPETVVYDPKGLLAYQARGPVRWTDPAFAAEINAAERGVKEID